MPKSIAHGCGNTLLQHGKELVLHGDLREGDKMLFYTYLLRRPSIVVERAATRRDASTASSGSAAAPCGRGHGDVAPMA